MISDSRLYLTRDKAVVKEGDVEAHELLVGQGCELEDELAVRYGLEPGAQKAMVPAENKSKKPGGNK